MRYASAIYTLFKVANSASARYATMSASHRRLCVRHVDVGCLEAIEDVDGVLAQDDALARVAQ